MLCRESLPALTEINLVTINRDTRTQRRQPEAKSQSDEVGRREGGRKGFWGETSKNDKDERGRGRQRGSGGTGGERGSFGRDFITAIILRRQH